MEDINAAKAWFKSNIMETLRLFGKDHQVQREDIYLGKSASFRMNILIVNDCDCAFLVVGALETRDYGLFVSHEHPDGEVHFNVFTDRRVGQDWGSFSTDSDVLSTMPGPEFHLERDASYVASVHATKISRVHAGSDPGGLDAVLLAKLRFKPDEDEPTRL